MARTLIADRIQVHPRYVRAVDIERDLTDPASLEGYILTSRAREALMRLSTGLSKSSTQRAFRITGPYGSGKSSFGLLLAKLAGDAAWKAEEIISPVLGKSGLPDCEILVLTGSRTSLARDLLNAVGEKASALFGEDSEIASQCGQLRSADNANTISTKAVLSHLTRLGAAIAEADGRSLLVLVDEMGRYLEYAAAHPRSEDPALFQQLAERASGRAHPALGVVAFLHHRFDDYLGSSEGWTSQEWARSAERYEEIAFSEPREQAIYLVANALERENEHAVAVRKAAKSCFESAAKRSLFAIDDAELVRMGGDLYPLHPAALSCLTMAASRFGQHDRSVFSFLQSSEPAGYLQFAHSTAYGADQWYRLDQVYDYMSTLGSLRFDGADRDRRWAMGREAVEGLVCGDKVEIRVLKSVAVIAALEPLAGLRSDADTLSWALDIPCDDVEEALSELARAGILYARASSRDYSLWSNSSVDLSHWYAEAQRAISKPSHLNDDIASIPPLRPVIAQRHYHRAGTLRSFLPAFGEAPIVLPDSIDGRIAIIPVNPGEQIEDRRRHATALSERLGPLALVHLKPVSEADLTLSHELKCWRWVAEACKELRMDDLARGEVQRNIVQREQQLQSRLSPFDFDANGESWFYLGTPMAFRSRSELSRKLSAICDDVFKKAPKLRNELINRSKLSTAIAAARMRLLKLMIEEEGKESLGLEGAPPEKTIYRSMLQATGMHREEEGTLAFHPPAKSSEPGWHHAWKRVEDLVRSDDPVSFEELIEKLAEPPTGLRAGPALLLIAAVMLHHRTTIALIERGTFQPELSQAHFMRLLKNPKHFALRKVAAENNDDLLQRLSNELSIFATDRPEPELKPVVERIFVWWRDLNAYARTTNEVSGIAKSVRLALKKARDPIQFVFLSLPQACNAVDEPGIDDDHFIETFDAALCELEEALPRLRIRASEHIRSAFGARSLKKLREQLRSDYEDHLAKLGDYKLKAFVERAMNQDLTEALWLDRVASLLVGKRLEGWDDTHLDQFGFEVNAVAQELARRLAILRKEAAGTTPITAIHITTSGGADRAYFLHEVSEADEKTATKLRKLLAGVDRPEAVLIKVLQSMLADKNKEDAQ